MQQILQGFKLTLLALAIFFLALPALAAPPVRVAIMPGGGSGIEQEIVDNISSRFDGDPGVVLSTVNPDWYCICNIHESNDQVSGQIRYNGTVTIKTGDGQVVSTVAVQKYNQDFSLQPGAPLNKKLVDNAARDVVSAISERAANQLRDAIQTELQSRDQIIKAETLANSDKYDEAISVLSGLGPDTVHFKAIQKRISQFQIEKQALELIQSAEAKAKSGRYSEAIASLKAVDTKSKRYKTAVQLAGKYRALLASAARKKPVTAKAPLAHPSGTTAQDNPTPKTGGTTALSGSQSKLDALIQVEKQALQERKQQIEKEQQALTKPPIGAR
ncbi:MAG: hypothetical protein C5B53_02245 [Candidatus Melainabacteria bacterium]|nr:MAG: hypothetical protein C5B53_02245 [Candidatus Melainabacteria bacterium]